MPKVAADTDLLDAAKLAVRKHGNNKAAAARELGVTRVFMTRFLKDGRAIDSTKRRLRRGLEEQGYIGPSQGPLDVSFSSQMMQDRDIVKQTLRYLLNAVEAYDEEGSRRGL